jgi:hypothetical protein
MTEIVYIPTNPVIPELVKVGRRPKRRLRGKSNVSFLFVADPTDTGLWLEGFDSG